MRCIAGFGCSLDVESTTTVSIFETVLDGDVDMEWLYTYTNGSFTETTKTLPACFSLGELTYPGIWLSEHDGEKAAGTPMIDLGSEPAKQYNSELTNDHAFTICQFLREVNLVTRRAFHEVDIGNFVADFDEYRS